MKKNKKLRVRATITPTDIQIFHSLSNAHRPLSIKQLAQRTAVSWPTVKIHVDNFVKLEIFKVDKSVRKTRVSIDPDFILRIKNRNLITEEVFETLKRDWIK